MSGRPRTAIGTFGAINVINKGPKRHTAHTRFRDIDGRLREVEATSTSRNAAIALLKERLKARTGYGAGGLLHLSSPFGDLAELWLADLEMRDIVENTKNNYRDDLRLHVGPFFEHYTLGEITTGRVEAFLKAQQTISYSRAKHTRTLLNQLFGFALRHDVLTRNPVEGTSPLPKPKNAPQALTWPQITAIRAAAAAWRTGPDVKGPRPDGRVRDAVEVLLGTGMRPGEVLALRPADVLDRQMQSAGSPRRRMVVHVCGTVVTEKGKGTYRQDHPKTDASDRWLPVPEFAATVIRDRLATMRPEQAEWTLFHNRNGRPMTLHNFRRTFREFLDLAGLAGSGISPRWYRRTGATVLARGLGVDVASTHLGHTSAAITEGHYIEPDTLVDHTSAAVLQKTLRPGSTATDLLTRPTSPAEEAVLDEIDDDPGDGVGTAAITGEVA
ncbi:tyrosine-type recombinase/integrase [Nocardioides sp. NPDC047086]|uniref:tyrosine-type recombinase/integrase n=1 Tax=Nocardioides sp. NPDC047086 TaxID=3154810 RepID=UPI0033F59DAD